MLDTALRALCMQARARCAEHQHWLVLDALRLARARSSEPGKQLSCCTPGQVVSATSHATMMNQYCRVVQPEFS